MTNLASQFWLLESDHLLKVTKTTFWAAILSFSIVFNIL